MPGAIDLYRRASDLLPPGHPDRLALVATLGKAYLESARNEELARYLQAASAEAREVGDATTLAHAAVLDGFRVIWSGVDADPAAAHRAAATARPTFLGTGDERGLTRVELLLAEVAWMEARMADAFEHWARAAVHARASGDAWEISEAVALTAGLAFGRGATVDVALAATREVLAQAAGDPMITFRCLRWVADLTGWRDGPEAGRAALDEVSVVAQRLRLPIWQAELDIGMASLALVMDDFATAERVLGPYLQPESPVAAHWSRAVAALGAHLLAATGRPDDARRLLDRSQLLTGTDVYVRVGSAIHVVAALHHLGDPAVRTVAVGLVDEADRLGTPGVDAETRLALARVCLAEGDAAAAVRWAEEAAHRFEVRGMCWFASEAAALRDRAVAALATG
jgi:tetratricopeptide (TPR) repeat protein